jgi:putative methyltransferase (TIGR04325 family)
MAINAGFNIWEGVYQEWGDAPEVGDAFNEEQWLSDQVANVTREIELLGTDSNSISSVAISRDYILPVVTALAGIQLSSSGIKILDFGGGLASSYALLMASLTRTNNVEFHIVESKGVCEKAEEVLVSHTNLHFHSSLPSPPERFEIIHVGRAFQYIDDWRGLLAAFAALCPKYLVLTGVLAGDITPFVSNQNYYGCKIRVRFLNLSEMIAVAEKLGFRLVYKALHFSKRLGKEGALPMDNFPLERRLEHPCQLLFVSE